MRQFTLVHPTDTRRNAVIRLEEEDVTAMIEALGKKGIQLYAATAQECQAVSDMEDDMEAHEPDIGYFFPEDKDKLLKLIESWNTPLTIADIIHIVAGECQNSCTGPSSAYEFIMKAYPERVADRKHLTAILEILNFAAIRENASLIYGMTA
jgi:hypothetical protein